MDSPDTIFTKIINRELPAHIAYEDADSMAFLDIHPVAMGHLLLVAREPIAWMQDVPDELVSKMFIRAKSLMKAMIAGLKCDYVQVTVVGKDVPHFHIHLIPRHLSDRVDLISQKIYNDGEAEVYLAQIKDGIKKASA